VAPRRICQGGTRSDECPWRDIFTLSAACCSRCCSFWTRVFQNPRSWRKQKSICPSFVFIQIGNGRSALCTIPASRRSFRRRSQVQRASSRRPKRLQTLLPVRKSGRRLRGCHLPLTDCRHPTQKCQNQNRGIIVKWPGDACRRPDSRWHATRNLVGSAGASGESGKAGPISAIVQRDQLGDAGGALAAFDFDHHAIVDPQAIGRDILYFRDAGILEPAGTGER
jgi:hypothetical protein